jgi:hypothetical protein
MGKSNQIKTKRSEEEEEYQRESTTNNIPGIQRRQQIT